MKKQEQGKLFVILISYLISWVVPIGFSSRVGRNGYDGAKFAHENLIEGITLTIASVSSFNIELFLALGKIVIGLPNILFIISLFLYAVLSINPLTLIGPCVAIMLYWGIAFWQDIGIGYTLWLVSAVALLFMSINALEKKKSLTHIGMMKHGVMYPTYLISLFLIVLATVTLLKE